MKLHEYQSKQIFERFGIPIPKGRIASTSDEVKQISEELGGTVVIKSQVLVGGRGKAGGIRLAKSPEEAHDLATKILGMEIKGLPVRKVLVDEAISIEREFYVGIVNDRKNQTPVLMVSAAGGMEIEEVAQRNPEKIIKVYIDPLLGLRDYQLRDAAIAIDLPKPLWKSFIEIVQGLWRAYESSDATLAEINPLVISAENKLVALDAKMVIDDNALFRHADLADMRDMDLEAASEVEARKYGVTFIKMNGNIGCMVNGAGLAMATMDILALCGGEAANFLDIGGGASADKVAASLRVIISDKNVRSILVNVFGGITRCDEVAKGILSASKEVGVAVPMVVRLVGTNEEEGRKLLKEANFNPAETLYQAAQMAVKLAVGEQK
ncbi:MAG: ADP-forming succinate--CoA ligase subunit beta [Anaerolineaceae bacterium]|nr:ADP-forming succinate--CoA ligase subunit beta [Anaerolineaceae bacterium]